MSAEAHPTFAQALREAIQARGLELDRIRWRFGEHGVAVSMATLSYWQSGRSRPGRALEFAATIDPMTELPRE
jgi:hypothetical protein